MATSRGKWLAGTALAFSVFAAGCGSGPTTVEVGGPAVTDAEDVAIPGLGAAPDDTTPADSTPTEPATDIEDRPVGEGLVIDLGSPSDDGAAVRPPTPAGTDAQPERLAMVTQNLAASEEYRFELSFGMSLGAAGADSMSFPLTPMSTGTVDGELLHMSIDPAAMLTAAGLPESQLAAVFGTSDPTIEMISGDGGKVYIRSSMLAGLASAAGASSADYEALAGLSDRWGVIDAAAFGLSVEQIAEMTGTSAGGPDQILGLLQNAGARIEDLGSETVRGVETTHLRGVVSVGDMMKAQGQDLADLGVPMGDFADLMIPFDIWVDGDQRVRRVLMNMDMEQLAGATGGMGISGGVQVQYDLFDYGAPDISVEIPSNPVDIATAFLSLGDF